MGQGWTGIGVPVRCCTECNKVLQSAKLAHHTPKDMFKDNITGSRYTQLTLHSCNSVTLCVTPHRDSNPHFSMTRTRSKTPTTYPFYPQTLILFSELCVPDPTRPSPFHTLSWLPWPRLCNPILDLLIPLLRLQPCIVPHSYKSESPMYCGPSLNID